MQNYFHPIRTLGKPRATNCRDRYPSPMSADRPDIPVAPRVAHSFTHHGVTIEDPYAWLRDPGLSGGQRPQRARLSRSRERLFRSGDEAASEADRHAVRRDEGPGEGRRCERAAKGRRIRLLACLRPRRGIPQVVPAAGRRRRRCGHSGRTRARARSRVFPARRPRRQPGRPPARLCGRYQRLRTLRSEGARSRNRRGASRRHRELALRPGLGRGFKELPLHRRRRALAVEDRLAPPAWRSAIGGPRHLPRAR